MAGGHKAIVEQDHELLPGVLERMRLWETQGHKIVLLMGHADSGRILINDISPYQGVKCHAIPVVRDGDWNKVNWTTVGLDNTGK